VFNPQCLRPNRTASNYTTKFCSFFSCSENQKKCLLNAVLQYLQPTDFYTPVIYGENEKCIILLNCIILLPFCRLLTDNIKMFKKRKNVTKIKKT